ncbi:anthranilate synthase component I family protein [Aquidulcibacter sp.]|jgi:para-aminobenzoate synthetase component 1|uniref:anthranilate synthase component I family protein n=1 Tax=Aquidulcibacter sp. TaxID=2052990 RepID=UPI0034ECF785
MGGDPFAGLQEALTAPNMTPHPDLGPFQGGWAGLLGYELGHAFEALPETSSATWPDAWPDVWLGLYDTLAVFDAQSQQAWALSWGLTEAAQLDHALAKQRAHNLANLIEAAQPLRPQAVEAPTNLALNPVQSRGLVESQIARAIDYIQAGDIFQANISARFSGQLEHGDTPFDLFSRLMGRHPSPFAAYLSLGDKIVASHSPERFISRTGSGLLETRPIKGTATRHKDPIQDARNAQALLASQKDRAENLMIVDLMRNDIARVCEAGSVKVPRLCDLESFSTVHHLVSEVGGQQKPGLGFFDALRSCFPPGSITGAPKVRAMEIISELEGEPRGPWCGSMIRVGFDGAADSNVLIRTAACQKQDDRWHIDARAGAGIVADSEPSQEYEEILVKARALRIAAHGGDVL